MPHGDARTGRIRVLAFVLPSDACLASNLGTQTIKRRSAHRFARVNLGAPNARAKNAHRPRAGSVLPAAGCDKS
jgi:hypothetical protein